MNLHWKNMTLPERKHGVNTSYHGPRVTENEQVKMPTRGYQGPVWPDTIALKKSDGSCTIQGFLKKEKAKVEKNQDVKRKIPRVEFEEFERSNNVPVMVVCSSKKSVDRLRGKRTSQILR